MILNMDNTAVCVFSVCSVWGTGGQSLVLGQQVDWLTPSLFIDMSMVCTTLFNFTNSMQQTEVYPWLANTYIQYCFQARHMLTLHGVTT